MRNTKTVYSYNYEGVFVGNDIACESWNFDGTFIIPGNSTEVAPPEIPEGYLAKWNGSNWRLENIPEPTPEPTPEPESLQVSWERIRGQRNYLLSQTDWIFAPDVNVNNKEDILVYRQVLRDIPQNFANPEDVVWPEKP
jgi:hypothetical protein